MAPDEGIQLGRQPEEPPPPGSMPPVKLEPDGIPEGFEEAVVIQLSALPHNKSIHRTLRSLADIGMRQGMTATALKNFFLTNKSMFEYFAYEVGDTMEARLTLPREVPPEMPREVIERAARGMIDYFLNHVEEGSLFDHIGVMERDCPPEALEDFRSILASQRFQEVVMEAFRPFIGMILDKMFAVSGIRAEVQVAVKSSWEDEDDDIPEDPTIGHITPPFDLLQQLRADGIDEKSRKAYIDVFFRSPTRKLNQLFYHSDDGFPHLASQGRKSAAPAAAIES